MGTPRSARSPFVNLPCPLLAVRPDGTNHAVNGKLPKGKNINTHDMQCINRVFDILKDHPEFAYKPHRLASPQYSEAFVDWVVQQFNLNNNFFAETRRRFRALR